MGPHLPRRDRRTPEHRSGAVHRPGPPPNSLRIANEVFGGLVSAGWPRREASSVGAAVRYFVVGSALGSFASGFPADAAVYSNKYPNLDGAHLLAARQQRVDRRAFDAGLQALLDGLELRYQSLA